MSNWKKNRVLARTHNTEPSLTDQSGADDTNINVIMRKYAVTGQAPGSSNEPMYTDWTGYPNDLRGFIETSRRLAEHRNNLPDKLKNMTIEELNGLTYEQLKTILTPEPKTDPKEDEK